MNCPADHSPSSSFQDAQFQLKLGCSSEMRQLSKSFANKTITPLIKTPSPSLPERKFNIKSKSTLPPASLLQNTGNKTDCPLAASRTAKATIKRSDCSFNLDKASRGLSATKPISPTNYTIKEAEKSDITDTDQAHDPSKLAGTNRIPPSTKKSAKCSAVGQKLNTRSAGNASTIMTRSKTRGQHPLSRDTLSGYIEDSIKSPATYLEKPLNRKSSKNSVSSINTAMVLLRRKLNAKKPNETPDGSADYSLSGEQYLENSHYKLVKPLQTAFNSSGLSSKKREFDNTSNSKMLPPNTPNKLHSSFSSNHPKTPGTPSYCKSDSMMTEYSPQTSTTSNQRKNTFHAFRDISISESLRSEGPSTPTKSSFIEPEKRWNMDLDAFKTPMPSRILPNDILRFSGNTPFRQSNIGIGAEYDIEGALESRFKNVIPIGWGEFSEVYEVTDLQDQTKKYAIKRVKLPSTIRKEKVRQYDEVNILMKLRGHDHVVELYDYWEHEGQLFLQLELCDNGSLDQFLREIGRVSKLDEFRVWKILTELAWGLKHIHDNNFIHLDLKPANILITFEGYLKIGDFGMASVWPASSDLEREGDREYIAPEILANHLYDKPADVFSLGLIVLEAAANIELPDYGLSWQKLRSGDLSDAPPLSASENLAQFAQISSEGRIPQSCSAPESSRQLRPSNQNFHDILGQGGLDRIVRKMLCPDYNSRPTITEILNEPEVVWVERVRQAGAIIAEDEPLFDIEGHECENMDEPMPDWRVS